MSQLKINASKNLNSLSIKLVGQLDENATLSKIEVVGSPAIQNIRIDWDGVKVINSDGIKEWIKWVQTVPKDIQIAFEKCPRIVINQVNLVNGFLPKGATIHSFYVPYFCLTCDYITPVLCSAESSFSNHQFNPPRDIRCNKCSQETELDIIPAKYFRFLKGELL